MSSDKTSSSQSSDLENELFVEETMDVSDSKKDRTRSQYDSAYCKRAVKTGCIIMGFTSVVSLFGRLIYRV